MSPSRNSGIVGQALRLPSSIVASGALALQLLVASTATARINVVTLPGRDCADYQPHDQDDTDQAADARSSVRWSSHTRGVPILTLRYYCRASRMRIRREPSRPGVS